MKTVKDFYEKLHRTQGDYSGGLYHMPALFGSQPFCDWGRRHRDASVRLLDVGCGKGVFLRGVVKEMRARYGVTLGGVNGVDLVKSPDNVFAEISDTFAFRQQDTDGQPLPFETASMDFVSCNHVLEHIFETEALVRELRRVLAPGGLGVVSVPNTAAWINRIAFFLWGNQPLGSELGTESVTYGFRPKYFHKHLSQFHPSGHIRDFCPRGLQDLCEACGFRTVGWWKQSFGLAARLGKWGGLNVSILLAPDGK